MSLSPLICLLIFISSSLSLSLHLRLSLHLCLSVSVSVCLSPCDVVLCRVVGKIVCVSAGGVRGVESVMWCVVLVVLVVLVCWCVCGVRCVLRRRFESTHRGVLDGHTGGREGGVTPHTQHTGQKWPT